MELLDLVEVEPCINLIVQVLVIHGWGVASGRLLGGPGVGRLIHRHRGGRRPHIRRRSRAEDNRPGGGLKSRGRSGGGGDETTRRREEGGGGGPVGRRRCSGPAGREVGRGLAGREFGCGLAGWAAAPVPLLVELVVEELGRLVVHLNPQLGHIHRICQRKL